MSQGYYRSNACSGTIGSDVVGILGYVAFSENQFGKTWEARWKLDHGDIAEMYGVYTETGVIGSRISKPGAIRGTTTICESFHLDV